MQEKISKLKEFLDNKGQEFPKDIIKTAINVCLETQNIDLALSIAYQKKMHEEYLQILILKQNKLIEALDYINEKKSNGLLIKDRINLFNKFGEYFVKNEQSDIPDLFYNKVINFIDNHIGSLDKNDVMKLIEIFIASDKYFISLFEKMNSYGIEFNKDMIHRRIELYFEEGETNKNDNYKEKILKMIKDEKFKNKYDYEYLIMLFKYKDFNEGIETLSEIINEKHDLLNIYMSKKEYDKIIDLCTSYIGTEISSCGIALNYFVDKELRKNLNEEEIKILNDYLKKFLNKILDNNIMLPVKILDIINEKNNELPIDILNDFLINSLDKEIIPVENSDNNINQYKKELLDINSKIKDLNTKAYQTSMNKCDDCGMDLSYPTVCFKCGHNFHRFCLTSSISNEIVEMECIKCKKKKNKINSDIIRNDKFYEFINNSKNLEKEYEKKDKTEDKIDYFYKLYGQGLFKLDPLEDDQNPEIQMFK